MRILKGNLKQTMKPFVKMVDGQLCMKPKKVNEAIETISQTYGGEGCATVETNEYNRDFLVVYAADQNHLRKVAEYYIGEHQEKPKKKESNPKKEAQKQMKKEAEPKVIKGENYEIQKQFGVLSESSKGWQKEVNLVAWYGKEAKYDIRDWSPEHDKMGKGVSLSLDEMRQLYTILQKVFGNAEMEASTDIPHCGISDLDKKWDSIVDAAPVSIKKYLDKSVITTLSEDTVVINLKKGCFDNLVKAENNQVLKVYVSKVVGKVVKVELTEPAIQ